MSIQPVAEQIIAIAHRVAAKQLVTGTDGNISARMPGGTILTTPTSMHKGFVSVDDLVEVSIDGRQVRGTRQPSTEIKMHLFIYQQRPDVQAVVHCHPVYATGFAAAGIPMTNNVFPEVIIGIGEIPLAPYATPSTEEVVESLRPFITGHDAILLANHGAVSCGVDLWDACFKMEKLEQTAHMLFVAELLGGARQLSADQTVRLKRLATTVYNKK
ncbi:MAG: class II aldolase/adducin family protein [Bacteriovoracaceae bacterium]|nr:class II aldolase/adducin family protein [Bacteroidota bacterium]